MILIIKYGLSGIQIHMILLTLNTQNVWIYNQHLNKCMHSNYNNKLTISDCDNSKNSIW